MGKMMIIGSPLGDKQPALERGMRLAQKLGLEVIVVGFCYESLAAQGVRGRERQAQARRRIVEAHRQKLEQEVAARRPEGLRVLFKSVWAKEIRNWIVRECDRRDYELVVKTGHRSETFAYSSTDWTLLRECAAPVMIVCERQWRKTRPLLAALDLSSRGKVKRALNEKVMTVATAYAQALGCELNVVHAIHLSPILTELDLVDEASQAESVATGLQPAVDAICEKFNVERARVCLKRGPVDKVIASEAARVKAQLVVMGTVGRAGVKARLLGNTAEQVLAHLRTDVLALKP